VTHKPIHLTSFFVVLVLLLILVPAGEQPTLAQAQSANMVLPAIASDQVQVDEKLRNAPLMFIENVGQFDKRARFQVRGADRTIWLAEDGVWVTVFSSMAKGSLVAEADPWDMQPFRAPTTSDGQREAIHLKLSFVGSNPHSHIEPFDRLGTRVSHFIGNNPDQWHTNVPAWGGVRYLDIYPGMDLEVTSEGGRWVWRLLCGSDCHSDSRHVQLKVDDANGVTLAEIKDAIGRPSARVNTALGEFGLPLLEVIGTEAATPQIALSRLIVPFATEMLGHLNTSALDGSEDLFYATFLGGGARDLSGLMVVDESGNAYVAGTTSSPDFPATNGPGYDTSYNENKDAFVVKLDSNGTGLEFASFIGGSGIENGGGITLDSDGGIYIGGSTTSSDFPVTAGAYSLSNSGQYDSWIAKLDSTGTKLVYATYLGGSRDDAGAVLAADQTGNIYAMGHTTSTDFPTTPGAFDTTHNSGRDVFVVKLDPSGSGLEYATYLGGSRYDLAGTIAVDGTGSAYITGWTESSDFPATPEAFDPTHNGGGGYYDAYDAFLTKINSDGTALVYSTFLGGTGRDFGFGVAVDGLGNAYVTGNTASSDFPVTSGAYDTSYNGGTLPQGGDVFLVIVNSTGTNLIYGTFVGGSGDDYGYRVARDNLGNVYVAGGTYSSDFPTTPGALDTNHNGGADAFVVKLQDDGAALAYGTFLGGGNDEWTYGLAVDGAGNVYISGETYSTDFPAASGRGYDMSYNGSGDAFVVKLCCGPCTTPFTWTELASSTPIGPTCCGSVVRDSARNRLVFFGPREVDGEHVVDTWEFDGCTWLKIETVHEPELRGMFAMTYDEARQKVVLFGGSDTAGLGRDDTWEYDGTDWTQISTPHAPSPRRELQYSMVYDSNRQRMVLFGGCYRGNPSICYNDTWEYDGTDWMQIDTPVSPSLRGISAMVFDASRNKVVLFSGYRNPSNPGWSSVLQDMWEYDGTTWTQINISPLPPGRGFHMMVYDTERNRVVLFGGLAPGGLHLNDTWEYDGISWQQIDTAIMPLGRAKGLMTYDVSRSAVLLLGGGAPGIGFSDFWQWAGGGQEPTLTVEQALIAEAEGQVAANTGTVDDPDSEQVTFNASVGTATDNEDGTWTWSYATSDGPAESQIVTICAVDDSGGTDQVSFDLVVDNVAPTATFYAPMSVDEGGNITLSLTNPSDSSPVDTAAGFEYAFDCGDGAGFGGFGPEASFVCPVSDDGTRTTKGKINDKDSGETVYTAIVTVLDLDPTAAFTWSPDMQDEGSPVQFIDESTSYPDEIVSWLWDFGGLGTSAEQNPSFVFLDDGMYDVCLTITDDDNSTDTICHEVTILDQQPTAAFTRSPDPQDEGSPVQFTDESISYPDEIVSWLWDFGGLGTSTERNPSFMFMDDGVYEVCLTVADDDDSTDTVCHDVTILDRGPTAEFTWSPESQVEGSPVEFTAQSTSYPDEIVTWSWDFGGQGVSSEQHPHYTFIDNDLFDVCLTVNDDDGSTDTACHGVSINNVPPTMILTGAATANEGDTVPYSYTVSDPSADTFLLDSTSCGAGGLLSNSVFDSNTGAGSFDCTFPNGPETTVVSVGLSDDDGGSGGDSLTVTISNVAPSVEAGADQNIFENAPVHLDPATFSDPGSLDTHNATIDWGDSTVEPGSVDQGAATVAGSHVYAEPGVYTVLLTMEDNDGDSSSDSLTITVLHGFLDTCVYAGTNEVMVEEDAYVGCNVRSEAKKVELKKDSQVTGCVVSRSDEVKVDEGGQVDGSVTANKKVELHKNAAVEQDVISGDDIELKQDAFVGGDATAAGSVKLESGATVGGTISQGANVSPLPPITQVSVSVSANGDNVTVKKNKTKTLAPGEYGKLKAKEKATLNLSGGEYLFEEFDLQKNVTLNLDVSAGPIIIGVEKTVDLHEGVEMTCTGAASDVLFQVAGNHVQLHKNGTYLGTFLAPQAHIDLHEDSTLTGALYGDKVQVKKQSTIIPAPAISLFVAIFAQ